MNSDKVKTLRKHLKTLLYQLSVETSDVDYPGILEGLILELLEDMDAIEAKLKPTLRLVKG